jgi:hypothetical protein
LSDWFALLAERRQAPRRRRVELGPVRVGVLPLGHPEQGHPVEVEYQELEQERAPQLLVEAPSGDLALAPVHLEQHAGSPRTPEQHGVRLGGRVPASRFLGRQEPDERTALRVPRLAVLGIELCLTGRHRVLLPAMGGTTPRTPDWLV